MSFPIWPPTAAVQGLQPLCLSGGRALPSAPGSQAHKARPELRGFLEALWSVPPPPRGSNSPHGQPDGPFPTHRTEAIKRQIQLKMGHCPCTFLKHFRLLSFPGERSPMIKEAEVSEKLRNPHVYLV